MRLTSQSKTRPQPNGGRIWVQEINEERYKTQGWTLNSPCTRESNSTTPATHYPDTRSVEDSTAHAEVPSTPYSQCWKANSARESHSALSTQATQRRQAPRERGMLRIADTRINFPRNSRGGKPSGFELGRENRRRGGVHPTHSGSRRACYPEYPQNRKPDYLPAECGQVSVFVTFVYWAYAM